MKTKVLLLILSMLILLYLTACDDRGEDALPAEEQALANAETELADYIKLTPEEAKEMIDTNDVIILDVRTEDEFRQGHIKGAMLIPDYELYEVAEEKLPDKDATILIYCRSGNRSKLASHLLIGMGYRNIYDFGGILDWRYGEVRDQPAD